MMRYSFYLSVYSVWLTPIRSTSVQKSFLKGGGAVCTPLPTCSDDPGVYPHLGVLWQNTDQPVLLGGGLLQTCTSQWISSHLGFFQVHSFSAMFFFLLNDALKANRKSVVFKMHYVNGLHLYSAFLTSGHSKHFTILPNIHPFIHTFTHRRRSQPRKTTASSSGAVRVRCLAQGHLDTRLREVEDRTSNLPVTSQLALYLLSHMPT